MTIEVVDLSSEVGRLVRSMEAALRRAEATMERAATLVGAAQGAPEMSVQAQGIYLRARARAARLRAALDRLGDDGEGLDLGVWRA
jgi:hypothetical protein